MAISLKPLLGAIMSRRRRRPRRPLWDRDHFRTYCSQCRRPAELFGRSDPDTGWHGWCDVCNWHWKYADGLSFGVWHRAMQKNNCMPHIILRHVRTFLISEKTFSAHIAARISAINMMGRFDLQIQTMKQIWASGTRTWTTSTLFGNCN